MPETLCHAILNDDDEDTAAADDDDDNENDDDAVDDADDDADDDDDPDDPGWERTHMPGPLCHLRLAVFTRVEAFPATFRSTWCRQDSHL